jgi:hypothetical protein
VTRQYVQTWAPNAKLTPDQAEAIRLRIRSERPCAVARAYGVHPISVWRIATGRTWRGVPA